MPSSDILYLVLLMWAFYNGFCLYYNKVCRSTTLSESVQDYLYGGFSWTTRHGGTDMFLGKWRSNGNSKQNMYWASVSYPYGTGDSQTNPYVGVSVPGGRRQIGSMGNMDYFGQSMNSIARDFYCEQAGARAVIHFAFEDDWRMNPADPYWLALFGQTDVSIWGVCAAFNTCT